MSNITVEVKRHFFEYEGFSPALQAGQPIPTGDDDENLGAGQAWGGVPAMGTQVMEPASFQFNAGRRRNETTVDEGFCL